MKQEMGSILQLLLPLTQDLSSSGRSEVVAPQEDLQAMLLQLKGVAQTLAQTSSSQVSGVRIVTPWLFKSLHRETLMRRTCPLCHVRLMNASFKI